MSSKVEVHIIKSPISPVRFPDNTILYANKAVYYVKLANGSVASGPEDFTNNEDEPNKVEEIELQQTCEETG